METSEERVLSVFRMNSHLSYQVPKFQWIHCRSINVSRGVLVSQVFNCLRKQRVYPCVTRL